MKLPLRKNINRGNHLASPFEIIFGRSPRISGTEPRNISHQRQFQTKILTISRALFNEMLRSHNLDPAQVSVGDQIYFWRDGPGWLGPARVTIINTYNIEFIHNGRTKNSTHNSVRRLSSQSTLLSSDIKLLAPFFHGSSDEEIVQHDI